jgi:Flp pilus assembly pilin Flp
MGRLPAVGKSAKKDGRIAEGAYPGQPAARGWKRSAGRTRRRVPAWLRNEEGIGTLEVVLIAAVVVILVVLFRDWITDFLSDLFGKVENEADKLF